MSFFIVEPEVPGGLGSRTVLDRTAHPPKVHRLHFVFDGWLGDELVESFPCFLITERLAQIFEAAGVTGLDLKEAEVELSEQFRELYPERVLPVFKWLLPVGTAGADDLFITAGARLGVSQKVLNLILATKPIGIAHRLFEGT